MGDCAGRRSGRRRCAVRRGLRALALLAVAAGMLVSIFVPACSLLAPVDDVVPSAASNTDGGGGDSSKDVAVGDANPDGPPASCKNQTKDGTETGLDCGGPVCPSCPDGEGCEDPTDCINGVCSNNVCAAPRCDDTVQNGAESDTDCGGDKCPKCPSGKKCNATSDCLDQVCTNDVCQAATCVDSTLNAGETDVDCGGNSCGDCDDGKLCLGGGDCKSGVCAEGPVVADGGVCPTGDAGTDDGGVSEGGSTTSVCQAATCCDGVKNSTE